jgi:hypothetical protein
MIERCTWPELAEPYQRALVAAVTEAFARCFPAGIVAAGTIVAGQPDPASDLDVYVVNRRPERQRIQRLFHGVPAELFINPRSQIERYFADERQRGRPSTAHMLANGFVVYDPDGVVRELRAQAIELLAAGPPISHAALLIHCYGAATTLEDALDIAQRDAEMCAALLASAVDAAIRYSFWKARRWQPRHKELLRALDEIAPEIASLARQFYRATNLSERIDLAQQVVQRAVGATGFFAWESEIERLPE